MDDRPDAPRPRPETLLVTGGRPTEDAGQPMNVPVVLASNYRSGSGAARGPAPRVYSRADGTDGWGAFEEVVGGLEGGRAVAFGSGMAAIAAICDLLPTGARVLLPGDCYQGTRQLLEDGAAIGRWEVADVDVTDAAAVRSRLDGAAMLWIETPSNPLLELADLRALVDAARDAGALTVVDNTFATPLLQRPLEVGADVVVHSATKFMGGHSDLLMGVAVTADDARQAALIRRRSLAGAVPGALECFLALRGLRTLAVRVAAAQATAGELARRLHEHPAVVRVRYPGLPTHPGHDLATAQMDGPGAVLSFELADGDAAEALCRDVRVIGFTTSLGGVETTVERRATHPGQEHIPAGLLRMSVGLEHVEDLWDDLVRALPEP